MHGSIVKQLQEFKIEAQGYIEMDAFDAEECWHICNWSCWAKEKPELLHSNIGVANSDIILHNPTSNQYYLALPIGWFIANSLEEVKQYCLNHHKS